LTSLNFTKLFYERADLTTS